MALAWCFCCWIRRSANAPASFADGGARWRDLWLYQKEVNPAFHTTGDYRAALIRAKQLIERGISYIDKGEKLCIRNLNTTAMTTDEKLDKIIAILERMEARQVKLKEEVEEVQTHEPPVTGSFGRVDTGENPARKPVS